MNQLWDKIVAQGIKILTWDDELYPPRLKEIDNRRRFYMCAVNCYLKIILQLRLWARQDYAVWSASNGRIIGVSRGERRDGDQRVGARRGCGGAFSGDENGRQNGSRFRVRCGSNLSAGASRVGRTNDVARHVDQRLSNRHPPDASNFPPRNRIISGLSLAVVVVEAGETSGALITAEFAAEQGREVFAVPGSILAPQSKGTNKLIQNGALPLLTPEDLMQALNLTRVGAQKSARKILPADEVEAQLMDTIGNEPMHVDEIRNQTGLPIEKVSAALVMMELKGMVRQVGGMNYVAVREVQSDYSA